MGGNRLTAYNWENNASNAGADWYHNSDNYLDCNEPADEQDIPANVLTNFNARTKANNTQYTLGTVQLAGYVAKTKDGEVAESEAAPSAKFAEVKAEKGSELSLTPDVTDNYIYTDEYINYLVNKIGTADTTGISLCEMARTTHSSLNGSKSSREPPPLPTIRTSQSFALFAFCICCTIFSAAPSP